MSKIIFTLLCLVGSFSFAQAPSLNEYVAAPDLDLDRSWLDPGEFVKIKSYDPASRSYEIEKVVDPTVLRIYTSPEYLARAIPNFNLEALKQKPTAIVGNEYETLHELILLEDTDLAKRRAKFSDSHK